MNSYPHEFLAHPRPLMFVAGLLPPASRDRSQSTAEGAGPSSRRPSESSKTLLAAPTADAGEAITTPITSPQKKAPSLPTSPPPAEAESDAPLSPPPPAGDSPREAVSDPKELEFQDLVKNLREALEPKSEKPKVWVPELERKDFRILLVDKNVRLPLRKVHPNPGAPQSGSESARSPLSPLTPTSPTYPDGLIAPVWVRKHSDLVPSVFVLFLRLFKSPPSDEPLGADQAQRKDAQERDADDALVREIGERRRRLGERGIKLTVVLMASAETLDSPVLDSRLSYLRRASALSSKASLFVLTPVPADQLPEFVQSLQEALYDAAVEYYTAHTKRVRRKRSRLPSTNLGNVVGSKGLSPGGWAVRYDWKAGWFAEIRGEYEIARRHYEDCWNELARLFTSTQLLPPRTKRWAEAKVLADCVAVRICRLLLYESEASSVLSPFFVHLKRFGDFSRGWGIGEDTFEFWSWIARQYRIFAELLELGTQSGLRIPPIPWPTFPTAVSVALPPSPDFFATPTSSLNPLDTLQQPAYYFYTAAICSVQRQTRFKEALGTENEASASEAGNTSGYVSTVPGFANEKKVDHAALIIEMFTKTYSLLKEQEYPQDRVALYVAYRIAETYCQSEQYEMAMRFFDRISNSFKRDKWAPIVREIRTLWYDCAQRTGSVETAVTLLLEMMASRGGVKEDGEKVEGPGGEEEDAHSIQDDLMGLLQTTTPASTDPIVIGMDADTALLDVKAGFWQASSLVNEPSTFQVVCSVPSGAEISNLEFSSLSLSFSDDRPDVTIQSSHSATGQFVHLGAVKEGTTGSAQLKWGPGQALVFQGEIQVSEEGEVAISTVRLNLKEGSWDIQLVFVPQSLAAWHTPNGLINPINEISSTASFTAPPHDVSVDVSHHPSAYIGETLSIAVNVKNNDTRDLNLSMSAFLQPGDEVDGSTITIDDQTNESLLENIPLGSVAAGSSVSRVINLDASEQGTKLLDISVQSVLGGDSSRSQIVEKNITIPVLSPFVLSSTVRYRQAPMTATIKGHEAFVSTTISSPGERKLRVESIRITPNDIEETKLLYTSLNTEDPSIPIEWSASTSFAILTKFNVSPARRPSLAGVTSEPPAHVFIKWTSNDGTVPVETRLPLPPLSHPTQESFLSGLIHSPPSAHLNSPFNQSLILSNVHPSANATDLHLQVDTAEAFVWVGSRLARLPVVPAGGEVVVNMEVVPVGGTGWFTLPTVRVWSGEGEGRSEVSVRAVSEGGARRQGAIFVRP